MNWCALQHSLLLWARVTFQNNFILVQGNAPSHRPDGGWYPLHGWSSNYDSIIACVCVTGLGCPGPFRLRTLVRSMPCHVRCPHCAWSHTYCLLRYQHSSMPLIPFTDLKILENFQCQLFLPRIHYWLKHVTVALLLIARICHEITRTGVVTQELVTFGIGMLSSQPHLWPHSIPQSLFSNIWFVAKQWLWNTLYLNNIYTYIYRWSIH